MNLLAIGRILSLAFIIIGLMAILPLGVAYTLGETPQIFSFGFTFIFCELLGVGGLVLTSFVGSSGRSGPSELLAFAFLWWFITPIGCCLPFVLGVANPSVYLALQEAVSCLTTTGYSVVEIGREGWPFSLIVWRGVLHLIGAFASIITLAGVLSQIDIGGGGIHKTPYFTNEHGDVFGNLIKVSVKICQIYILFGLLVFFVLVAVGVDFWDAFLDMASVLSTGNANPLPQDYLNDDLRLWICALGLLVSTAGFWFLFYVGIMRFWSMGEKVDIVAFGGIAFILVLMATGAGFTTKEAILWVASAISTSDMIQTSGVLPPEGLPLALTIIPALIGGAALSTTGGIKLSRILFIFKQFRREIHRSLIRHNLDLTSASGQDSSFSQMMNVWVYLITFAVAIAAMQLMLCINGVGWSDAIRLSIGAFCNAGGLIEQAQSSTNLTGISGGAVLIAMILGRLEVLPILVIFTKNFWTR